MTESWFETLTWPQAVVTLGFILLVGFIVWLFAKDD